MTNCIWADENCVSFNSDRCNGTDTKCGDYKDHQAGVELLKENKAKTEALHKERDDLEKRLPEKVIYQNEDGTYTRFVRTDNIKEINEGKTVWKSAGFNRYSTKIDPSLKKQPE